MTAAAQPLTWPEGWGRRTLVMGVLNLTPDSFSDGGRWPGAAAALRHAASMVAAGADLLDLGAQSTRPGAREVGPQREADRLLPVLQALRAAQPRLCLSVDTYHPAVAEAALAAGANWINDVRGGNPDLRDPAMARLVAAAGCPYVLMHSRGDSAGMDGRAVYDDVVEEVRTELLQATEAAVAVGVAAGRILWDPGLGFAKTTGQNLALLADLARLGGEGFPLLVGPSRKRFIGAVLDQPRPRARIWGTAAVCAHAIGQGAAVLRVHDVAPIAQTARMLEAIRAVPHPIA